MARLAVNIDHVATVRQARGIDEPDPVLAAGLAELAGAEVIICHLREDRRHIQDDDVKTLKGIVTGKLNLEMALSDEIIEIAKKVIPDQVTLVPEKREELTTEGGLDVSYNFSKIKRVVKEFHDIGIEVSLFIEPDLETLDRSRDVDADYIEIHTGTYCNAVKSEDIERELNRIYKTGRTLWM